VPWQVMGQGKELGQGLQGSLSGTWFHSAGALGWGPQAKPAGWAVQGMLCRQARGRRRGGGKDRDLRAVP